MRKAFQREGNIFGAQYDSYCAKQSSSVELKKKYFYVFPS